MNWPSSAGLIYGGAVEEILPAGLTMFDSTVVWGQGASGGSPRDVADISFFSWTVAIVGVIVPMLFVAYACGITADSMSRVHIILEGFKAVLGLMVSILAIGYAFLYPVQGRDIAENQVTGSS